MYALEERYLTPASVLADFYKISHREQYPEKTEMVYSTWTSRESRIKAITGVVAFGFQCFIKGFLIDYFDKYFFGRPTEDVVAEYKRLIKFTLGVEDPDASHIEALHKLGYLPIRIKAVKEGTVVPIRVPMLTIENTEPEFFWLTNYLETLMSCTMWMPSTSATIAFQYRKILEHYAKETGGDLGFVPFQGHDFSMRGMGALASSKSSGAAHLLSFFGTDTIPAICFLEEFYNADVEKEVVGTSIPATEHSVMCAHGQDEYESYRYIIEDVYPNGFVSIVSDTWDLWHVVGKVIPTLKDKIMARDGRVVIRPDSGDPVKIICGDSEATEEIIRKGVIESLWDTFGGTTNEKGYNVLDGHIGAIYGDSITLDRAIAICEGLKAKGFASTNVVFGIGSYTYQSNTRDTFGFALKSTFVVIDGKGKKIFKDPKTDNGVKKSQLGLVAVIRNKEGRIEYIDDLTLEQRAKLEEEGRDLLEDIFIDGKLVRDETLAEIRQRLLATL